MSPFLQFDGLTKRYGSATVLEDVSIALERGRAHALMGENGAGKSTFIKLIAGVVPADAMTVRKQGKVIPIASAADAAAAGFRFIHQELNIVPPLSVAENTLLGHDIPHRLGVFVNWREMARRAQAALAELGIDHIDVQVHAGALGTGDRMLIKLASALVSHPGEACPCLYVLDEPTAALNETEVEKLFAVVQRLKSEGAAILYVSHRMGEIMQICDDVTVLRNGRHVRTAAVYETNREEIILDMTGRDIDHGYPRRETEIGDTVVCQTNGIATRRLTGIELDLRKGEILGVGGLAGAGQTEVLDLFLGRERPLLGSASLDGRPLPTSPSEAWDRGVAYVPQERRSQGLMMRMGVRPNALLPHLTGLVAHLRRERASTRELARLVGLKYEGPEQSVWQLSGGNQQKVVFARALAGRPRLLLLDEPTRGVDIGAKFEIYGLMRRLSAEGCSIILSSSDLPELLGMCDRIMILHDGRQADLLDPKRLQPSDLLGAFYAQPSARSA